MWVYFRNQRQFTLCASHAVCKPRAPPRTRCETRCARPGLAVLSGYSRRVKSEEVCQRHFYNNAYDILEEKIT